MKRDPKYYCIKSFLDDNYPDGIIFKEGKWYNSGSFYDDTFHHTGHIIIAICLENDENSGIGFNVTQDPDYPTPLFFDHFASLKTMRKLKLQKINSK
jgi:hypothetical protein